MTPKTVYILNETDRSVLGTAFEWGYILNDEEMPSLARQFMTSTMSSSWSSQLERAFSGSRATETRLGICIVRGLTAAEVASLRSVLFDVLSAWERVAAGPFLPGMKASTQAKWVRAHDEISLGLDLLDCED